jgi:hypothetical protein
MSPKRLRWAGLACLALSALTVGLGMIAQAVCAVLAILLFHVAVQVPVSALGGAVGPTTLPVPRVLPVMLLVAGLFLATALVCFIKSSRRGRIRRTPARP